MQQYGNNLEKQLLESKEKVKTMRRDEVLRFKVGDIVYPLYREANFKIWGRVVSVMPEIHKVVVDISGMLFQYEPDELIPMNPAIIKTASSKKTASKTRFVFTASKH